METMLEGLVVLGGLTFSLATALLIEELIFGRIFRVVFVPHPIEPKPGSTGTPVPRPEEGFTTKDTKVHEGNSSHLP